MLSVIYIVLVGLLFLIGFFTNVKLHKHILSLVLSWLVIILPTVVFIVWAKNNSLASVGGSGFELALLLSAKLLFISTLSVFAWGWVKKFVVDFQLSSIWPLLVLYILIALAFAGIIFRSDNSWNFALYAFIIGAVIMSLSRLIYSLRFWIFELVALVIFSVVTFVQYLFIQGSVFDQFNISNLLFGFAFTGLFIVVFNWFDERWSTAYVSDINGPGLESDSMQNSRNYSLVNKDSHINNQPKSDSKYISKISPENLTAENNIPKHSKRIIRPSTKLASTLYDLRSRRRKDYTIQESYFKMPSFNFEQQANLDKK